MYESFLLGGPLNLFIFVVVGYDNSRTYMFFLYIFPLKAARAAGIVRQLCMHIENFDFLSEFVYAKML
jgi:hypothetical protein